MKIILIFLAAAVALAGALVLWQQRTLVQLREQSVSSPAASSAAANSDDAAFVEQQQEAARLREQTKELPRLRNEVSQLRARTGELAAARGEYAELLRAKQTGTAQQFTVFGPGKQVKIYVIGQAGGFYAGMQECNGIPQ